MPKKVDKYIYILCPSRAYLAPVKLMGPIVHPLKVTEATASEILCSGAKVFEYVPKTKKTLELTLTNIKDPNRYDAVIEKPVSKAVKVEPVTKTGVPVKTEYTEEINDSQETSEEVVETLNNTSSPLDSIVFEFNEDGTINENNLDWASLTKSQRKALRAKINTYNASIASTNNA